MSCATLATPKTFPFRLLLIVALPWAARPFSWPPPVVLQMRLPLLSPVRLPPVLPGPALVSRKRRPTPARTPACPATFRLTDRPQVQHRLLRLRVLRGEQGQGKDGDGGNGFPITEAVAEEFGGTDRRPGSGRNWHFGNGRWVQEVLRQRDGGLTDLRCLPSDQAEGS